MKKTTPTSQELLEKIKTIIKEQEETFTVTVDYLGEPEEREYLYEPADIKKNILDSIENL